MSDTSENLLGLVVFDLDGTLLRGDTVCEILAKPLGRIDEMKRFEGLTSEDDIADARSQMAEWYKGRTDLESYLSEACWAPRAHEAVQQLLDASVMVAIASITWKFAVAWFAKELKVCHYLGTDISATGKIVHVWARDKAVWLEGLATTYGVAPQRRAAVGDSRGDLEMFSVASLGFHVGVDQIAEVAESVVHMPGADLRAVASSIVTEWAA